jgi:alkanesulfonate monooxygenase SsuD/methylene tetrahydromethanopterin reductase-like flavin-dependent oxidoreductase (luciferase family)
MKFGVFDHMDDAGTGLAQLYADRLTITEAYDRAGFYGYHVAEHHATPLGYASSPGVYLSAVAQRTKQLRFGPLVYLLPFYHPLRLIEEICMLDQMSGGRLLLGVGRGVSPMETEAYGLDVTKTQQMYHEAFQVVMKGLTSPELTFEGEFYRFKNVAMLLRPVQQPHPPLWYGIGLPQAADWPAANDVNIAMLSLRPAVRAIVERYRSERARLGKPDNTLLGLSRHIVVADTDAEALRIAQRAYPRWRESFRWLWAKQGKEPSIIGLYPPTWDELQAMGNGMAGSPATVRDFVIDEIKETGVNYYAPWLAFGGLKLAETLRSIELFAQHVMPAFARAPVAAE